MSGGWKKRKKGNMNRSENKTANLLLRESEGSELAFFKRSAGEMCLAICILFGLLNEVAKNNKN